MFWLLRPPYVRWFAAAAVFAAAGALDMASEATEPFPFAGDPIAAGAPVIDAVEWREAPRGLLPEAGDLSGFASRPIDAGEPLTASAIRASGGVPTGWWSVPVELPAGALEGAEVRLLSVDAGLDVVGVVTQPATAGAFSTVTPGMVAVAPDVAPAVAAAAELGQLIVLLAA